jgi:hypothetical protein
VREKKHVEKNATYTYSGLIIYGSRAKQKSKGKDENGKETERAR